MKKFLFVLLQCTWGFFQTLLGFFVFLRCRNCPHKFYRGAIDTQWNTRGGMSLGLFIFTPPEDAPNSQKVRVHEYGHCFQWISVEAESFEELAAMNIQQSSVALQGLWAVYALVPVIGLIIATFFYLGYKLNDKDVQILAKCNSGEITRAEAESLLSRKY